MSTLAPALPRDESALGKNLADKGQNAYYYAHGRTEWQVPEDAKVVTGDGIITGGPPVKIEGVEKHVITQEEAQKPREIKSYSWVDDKKDVKVYVELADFGDFDFASDITTKANAELNADLETAADGAAPNSVLCAFLDHSFTLRVRGARESFKTRDALLCVPLSKQVVPENCKWRVSAGKKRVTVTLRKENEAVTWYDLRKR